jgi:D-serine deaminase-like pyridoxal phosphate-dependent protein
MTLYSDVDTPALLFDMDVVERNIVEMAAVAATAGVALRPHAKTHKSPLLAKAQLDAGATGITVASLGEAEVMVDAGIDDILIAFPLVGGAKLRRLAALVERARIRVSLDAVEVAEPVGRLGLDRGRPIPVLVEVDTGLHRMGRPAGAPSAELALQIARVPGVDVIGLLTHGGHAYRATDASALAHAAEREAVDMRLGVATEATCAARVLTTVVARPTFDRFVIDAGTKAFSSDGGDGPPLPGRGFVVGRPDLILDFMSEEHGVGHRTSDHCLEIGERLEVIPLHVCAAVNLFDRAYGIRGGAVEQVIPIAARGRSG